MVFLKRLGDRKQNLQVFLANIHIFKLVDLKEMVGYWYSTSSNGHKGDMSNSPHNRMQVETLSIQNK